MTAATQAGTLSAEVRLGGVPYPLALGPGGIPAPIDVAPQVAFPDAIILGDSSLRSDQRVATVIQSDWRGGIGTMSYIESQAVNTVRDSVCETRYPGMITCPRRDSTAYNVLPGAPLAPGQHIEYFVGTATNLYLAWAKGQMVRRYDWDLRAWVTDTTATFLANAFARFTGYAAFSSTTGLYYSADALTWRVAPGMQGSCTSLATHDNKLWTFSSRFLCGTSILTELLPWPQYASLDLQLGEVIVQLFDWRNARGARALYVLTNQRIVGYDDDDREFSTFYDFTDLLSASSNALPNAHVWRNNDDLYVTFWDPNNTTMTDTVLHFNGSVVEVLSPNKLSGLYGDGLTSLLYLLGSENYLYAFAGSRAGGATGGRILALTPDQGWHTVYTGTSANPVVGGGYATGTLHVVRRDGTVTAFNAGNQMGTPLTFSGPIDYVTTASTVESADLDGGTPGITKRLLWARVACLVPDATVASKFGLPTGATVKLEYRIDNGGWTALTNIKVSGVVTPLAGGVLDSTVSFPATLPIANELGVSCTRWNWRLSLTPGTGGTSTPIVTELSWHYIRQPEVRYSYRARVDLRDEQWGGEALPQFGGRTAAQLRATLLSWPGNGLTTFGYGQGAAEVNLAAVDVVVRPVEDPLRGVGIYDVVVRDLTTPDGGV